MVMTVNVDEVMISIGHVVTVSMVARKTITVEILVIMLAMVDDQ